MRLLEWLSKILRDDRGVATSLIEATATVAVGAVLASVAVGGAVEALNDSKVEAAKNDVSVIGQAMLNFFKDNAFFPVFKDGMKTGPDEDFFSLLVSEEGTYPSSDFGDTWRVGTRVFYANRVGKVGHQLAPDHDAIEGHLIFNLIRNGNARSVYPMRGSSVSDQRRGWAGPYMSNLPKSDPWGNKYMVNVQELHTRHLREIHATTDGILPRRAVVVLSAGPNGLIETPSEQNFDVFQVRGDDILFRVR